MSQLCLSTSSSTFIFPDAQPDPFREFFTPPSLAISDLLNTLPNPDPDPDSDSRNSDLPDPNPDLRNSDSPDPDPDSDPDSQGSRAPATSRDERIAIQTALKFKISHSRICEVLHITKKQIKYARNHQVTPQKFKPGCKALLCTPQRNHLKQWLLESPSHQQIPFRKIP